MLWFASTCVLNGVTFTVFPSFVPGYLSSRSPNTIRRNAIFLPLYSILLLVPVMLGLAASLVVPKLDTNDLALLTMVTKELPGWVVGIVGVAGALSAIVVPLALSGHDPLLGVNVGLFGLVANAIVNVALSRARPQPAARGDRFQRSGTMLPSPDGSTMPSSSHS